LSKFSERLLFLREKKDISQKALAKEIDKTIRAYQRYEYGEREPQLTTLISLAKFYDVSLDYLSGLSDDPGRFPS